MPATTLGLVTCHSRRASRWLDTVNIVPRSRCGEGGFLVAIPAVVVAVVVPGNVAAPRPSRGAAAQTC